MESRVFVVAQDVDSPKCGGCNWEVSKLYARAATQQAADELYQEGDAGLCGDCFCEMLMEEGSTIILAK